MLTRSVSLVTECSGLETPLLALMELGFEVDHCSSTEYATGPQRFILRNFKPKNLYADILNRAPGQLQPNSDFYIAGFPCKAFSSLQSTAGGSPMQRSVANMQPQTQALAPLSLSPPSP